MANWFQSLFLLAHDLENNKESWNEQNDNSINIHLFPISQKIVSWKNTRNRKIHIFAIWSGSYTL